jgi:hypothetical protein
MAHPLYTDCTVSMVLAVIVTKDVTQCDRSVTTGSIIILAVSLAI